MTEPTKNPLMKMLIGKTIVFLGLIAAIYFLAQTFTSLTKEKSVVNIVYVVRHAEKLTGPEIGSDPELSEAGKARSNILAELLRDKNISHIHSSDYIRTRNTGAPLAKILGVEIEIYDPRNLDALATKIKQQSANGGVSHLVIGHSNTVAQTVAALGGVDTAKPIYEKSEYDRLYKVDFSGDAVRTKLSRYGARYVQETTIPDATQADDSGSKNKLKKTDEAGTTLKGESKYRGLNHDATPLVRTPPKMPRLATQSGYCLIHFDIDALGNTFNVEAGKCSDDMFAESAANAVRQWTYSPKLENGVAVVSLGVETKVTFRLSTMEGDLIEEPVPVDENINDILSDDQKAKLAFEISNKMQKFSALPTSNYCCVRFDVSQIGAVFNEDIVTCSDYKLHADTKKLIRLLPFKPANYNGEKISSGGYTMLIKHIEVSKNANNGAMQRFPVIGARADKNELCQFD